MFKQLSLVKQNKLTLGIFITALKNARSYLQNDECNLHKKNIFWHKCFFLIIFFLNELGWIEIGKGNYFSLTGLDCLSLKKSMDIRWSEDAYSFFLRRNYLSHHEINNFARSGTPVVRSQDMISFHFIHTWTVLIEFSFLYFSSLFYFSFFKVVQLYGRNI